jgi:hypothetical protein
MGFPMHDRPAVQHVVTVALKVDRKRNPAGVRTAISK